MKFYAQSPLKLLLFAIVLIFQFSCSKDSDLLSDYVISDTQVFLSGKYAVADEYQLNSSSSLVLNVLDNDNFINGAEVVITGTSAPNNGTVIINSNQTLTYTPKTDSSTDEVDDTFTYTAEGENEDGIITTEEASVVITAADESNRQSSDSNISPWEYCQDGNPIGGGAGYGAILTTGTHIVSTNLSASAFKSFVEARTSGDVVFINSGVTLNLTALTTSIQVAGGVTIASDRGNGASQGALVFTDQMAYQGSGTMIPVFRTKGTGTRFTGFRFQGPYGGVGTYSLDDDDRRAKWGISTHYNDTEIDNMEIYNFPRAAIVISRYASVGYYGPNQWSGGHLIHHNYIHNNRQNSFGYGVDVQYGEAIISSNIFEKNRHDIAGRGEDGAKYTAYEAYCNTIKPGGSHHNFDMHPKPPEGGPPPKPAGKYLIISYNDFQDVGAVRSAINNEENIRIGGQPTDGITVTNNRFAHRNIDIAYEIINTDANLIEIINNNTFNEN